MDCSSNHGTHLTWHQVSCVRKLLPGVQGLQGLVEGLATYINARQIGLQPSEIQAAAANKSSKAGPSAALTPVVNNDLVKITPVLLQPAAAPQVRSLGLATALTLQKQHDVG